MKPFGVDQVGLSCGDLWSHRTDVVALRFCICKVQFLPPFGTHYDYGADDGDCSHGSMRDCVFSVWIADALVIAVDSSLVRAEHQCQDGRR